MKNSEQKIIYGLDELPLVVTILTSLMKDYAVFTFSGTLGSGKTTLVQSLLESCGVMEHVTSPTFTYVNCYKNNRGETFYHFDVYRIKNCQDFIQAGF